MNPTVTAVSRSATQRIRSSSRTTRASGFLVDLLGLPTATRLHLGETAVVEITGLRNPCAQLDRLQPGLMAAVMGVNAEGQPVGRTGVMAIVVTGGEVRPGDAIRVALPAEPHKRLERV